VLEDFAGTMAYRVGGLEGLNKAVECKRAATADYSSGLQVTGVFTEILTDSSNQPIYLRTTGPTALAFNYKQLEGHGKDRHAEGFGAPIGAWKETTLREGENAKLEFTSGVIVNGHVERLVRENGELLLVTFSNCTVKLGDRVLFDPAWGEYDMAVGEKIVSVFNGAADTDAYLEVALIPKERTIKVPSDEKRKKLENLYQQVRDIRERKVGYERLGEIWETQQAEHADDWLLSMEIFELLDDAGEQNELKQRIMTFLNQKKLIDRDKATLIEWGFRLVTYHKAGLETASQV
jgi:phenylalanine-4-hydroxylase